MASYYSLSIGNIINDLEAALNAKGLITTTHYKDSDCIIFTTPLITGKVIKFKFENSAYTRSWWYYGDTWSSGETITNQISFMYTNDVLDAGCSGVDLIADTNFFILTYKSGAVPAYSVAYVGKLDNNDQILFALSTYSPSEGGGLGMNITQNRQIYLVGITANGSAHGMFKDPSGNLLGLDLMCYYGGGILEMNGANPAKVVGVKCSSIGSLGSIGTYLGPNYYLTPSMLYQNAVKVFYTSLLVEFTP